MVSTGVNRDRNNPRVFGDSPSIGLYTSRHAEWVAISRYNSEPSRRAVMYIARVNRAGEYMMSRPCNKCWMEIQKYGIKEVVYTVGP